MERKILILSDLITQNYLNILIDISKTYGYSLKKLNNIEGLMGYLSANSASAVLIDPDKFEEYSNKYYKSNPVSLIPVFLLIEDSFTTDISQIKNYEGILLLDVNEFIFERELIFLFKYLSLQSKVLSTSKVIDPEFLRKILGDTAHAINNILTGMQGYAELAMLNPDDKKLIEDSFKVVMDSSYRVRSEIKNLRAFVRIENPIKEEIDIKDVISEAVSLISPQCRLKECNLNVEISKGYIIEGDKDQLVQVFFNILHDLVEKSSSNSNIKIALSEGNGIIKLSFESDGYTISDEELKNIRRVLELNEPVLKMDSEEGEIENKNIISMCGRIVFNHRGSLEITKKDSKVVYELKLPYIMPSEKIKEAKPFVKREHGEGFENLDMDILVVDDEEFVRNSLYYFFQQKGCRVTLAEDGKFGLELAKENPFDIIFMDYLMPKMGGIESAKEILKNRKDAKIVFITGRDLKDESEILRSGVYAIIKKPFEIEDIYSIAKKIAMEKGIGG